MPFLDRADAGRQLAGRLIGLASEGVVVLGLPRGGVPVAAVVARALDAPLDVVVVRKLGAPFQPELALGAVGEDGAISLNHDVLLRTGVDEETLQAIERRERAEVEHRAARYRAGRPPIPLQDRTAVLVDDGLATGSTAAVACQIARLQGARRLIVAAPVGPRSTVEALGRVADQVVVVETPESFFSVGQWYRRFNQTSDDEVAELLEEARRSRSNGPAPGVPSQPW